MTGAQGSKLEHVVTGVDAEILARRLRRLALAASRGRGDTLKSLANACGDYLHYGPNDPRPTLPEIVA